MVQCRHSPFVQLVSIRASPGGVRHAQSTAAQDHNQCMYVCMYSTYVACTHVHGLLTSAAAATLRVGWQLLPNEEGLSLGSPYSGGYSCMGQGQHCQTGTTHASTQSSGKLPPALSTYLFCILCPSPPLVPLPPLISEESPDAVNRALGAGIMQCSSPLPIA